MVLEHCHAEFTQLEIYYVALCLLRANVILCVCYSRMSYCTCMYVVQLLFTFVARTYMRVERRRLHVYSSQHLYYS
jgi:hypothetical protein